MLVFLSGQYYINTAMKCMQSMLQSTSSRISRLVLPHREVGIFNAKWTLRYFSHNLAREYSNRASWCHSIIWRNCSLSYSAGKWKCLFRIPCAVFILSSVDPAKVWDVLEAHLGCIKPLGADHIKQWIAEQIRAHSEKACSEIIKILDACQSCDPRSSAKYRNRKWTLDNLISLDIRDLNCICLHTMSALSNSRDMSTASGENLEEDDNDIDDPLLFLIN
ncbi:uncharacterized protein LOC129588744 [Paramacrobiotus metropolitanus]|uniref:uncharacterized protein LOC129588744 n=1 Tax=Paramacrobiotus metropolitanus TaxID=2943436 RepID=UPI0024463CE0|nr:uncharacterized protein LOC129588744 [Paramacrobiotus metropolitanus]